jgi:hypothetical protein
MVTGEWGRSALWIWEIEPSRVPRADLRPRTSEPPWFVWDGTGACNGTCGRLQVNFVYFLPFEKKSGKGRENGLREKATDQRKKLWSQMQ